MGMIGTAFSLVHALIAGPRARPARLPRAEGGRAPDRLRRIGAAACLPAALASVLLGLPAGVHAQTGKPDVRTQIETASRWGSVTLKLVDGQTVSGTFNGFIGNWSDSVSAALRYEEWRQFNPEGLPRLGEPLSLTTVHGDTLRGTFEGIGPTFLVIHPRDSSFHVMAQIQNITNAKSDGDSTLAPWIELRGRLLAAPSFVGVALKDGPQVRLVARESVVSAATTSTKAGSKPGTLKSGTLVIVGIVAAAALIVICVQAAQSASSSASNSANSASGDCMSSCSGWNFSSREPDAAFGSDDVSHGLRARAPGETRRP